MSATAILKPTLESFAAHVNTTSYEPEQQTLTSTAEENSTSNSRFSYLHKLKQDKLSNIRPLNEFFDRNRFNYTTSFQIVSQRWNYNLQYFSSNYFLIMLGLAIYSVLTNWWLLFTIAFIFGGFYMISKAGNTDAASISIAGTTISASTLYAIYAAGSILLLLFSGATGAIFWIIGASAILILGHAAMMEPGIEEGFADSQV